MPVDRPDPADPKVLAKLLPAKPKVVHRAALPYVDVPQLVAELRAIPLSDLRGLRRGHWNSPS